MLFKGEKKTSIFFKKNHHFVVFFKTRDYLYIKDNGQKTKDEILMPQVSRPS